MGGAGLIAALPGRWRVVRVIRHADGGTAHFDGIAQWRPDGGWLRCVEAGEMRQDGQVFAARRETLWRHRPEGVEVAFGDGRPFHVIGPDGRAAHDCAPDTYLLRYDLSAWPRWSVRWRVTGPRKDYRALTRYRREGA